MQYSERVLSMICSVTFLLWWKSAFLLVRSQRLVGWSCMKIDHGASQIKSSGACFLHCKPPNQEKENSLDFCQVVWMAMGEKECIITTRHESLTPESGQLWAPPLPKQVPVPPWTQDWLATIHQCTIPPHLTLPYATILHRRIPPPPSDELGHAGHTPGH